MFIRSQDKMILTPIGRLEIDSVSQSRKTLYFMRGLSNRELFN